MKPARVAISRLADDPIALRASIGGNNEVGFYCRFRGDFKKVAEMLALISEAVNAIASTGYEPDIEPDPPPHSEN